MGYGEEPYCTGSENEKNRYGIIARAVRMKKQIWYYCTGSENEKNRFDN